MRYLDFLDSKVEADSLSSVSRGILRALDVHGVGRNHRTTGDLFEDSSVDCDALGDYWRSVGSYIASAADTNTQSRTKSDE